MPRPLRYDVTKLVKLTTEQLGQVQAWRDAHGLDSDSEAIRQLIAAGIEATAEPEKPVKKRKSASS